jgi:hypothetical protein
VYADENMDSSLVPGSVRAVIKKIALVDMATAHELSAEAGCGGAG